MDDKHGGIVGMSGWLYADLMLILFVGLLAWTATPTQKQSSASTQQPAQNAVAAPPSLNRKKYALLVEVPPDLLTSSNVNDRVAFRRAVVEKLRQTLPADSRIGMVLTFGGAPAGQPGVGGRLAARANQLMQENLGDRAANPFDQAGFESFHDFTAPLNTVRLWIYVFAK